MAASDRPANAPEDAAPGYVTLHSSGELGRRVEQAYRCLEACGLCPRRCGVNRLAGETGYCHSSSDMLLGSWNVHRWEEPPISGDRGSGTVFFSNCTARCIFCQNYPISQLHVGQPANAESLADIMLRLQGRGCHNINLVTPTHYVPQILAALDAAAARGLHIPLLYNTSGYDSPETLALLDGVVDIYLPDAKYADDAVARELSGYVGYVAANRTVLLEMQRQAGPGLILDERGIARRGMIVRHLVLPGRLSQTEEVLRWLADHLAPGTHISLMSQYFPAHRAVGHPVLGRRLTAAEYKEATELLEPLGLTDGWQQELDDVY